MLRKPEDAATELLVSAGALRISRKRFIAELSTFSAASVNIVANRPCDGKILISFAFRAYCCLQLLTRCVVTDIGVFDEQLVRDS